MREKVGRWIAYANRGKSYMGLFTGTFVVATWVTVIGWTMKWWMYPLLILSVIIVWVVTGFLDTRYGFRKDEIKDVEKNSPIRMETYKMIKEMHKKL